MNEHKGQPPKAPRPSFKRYDLQVDLKPYISPWGGELALPNWEPIELQKFARKFVGMGGIDVYPGQPGLKVPENHYRTRYGRIFTTHGQGNGWDGCGYAIVDTGWGNDPAVGHWAICKHEKVEGAGANHMRGWHPGFCSKCGMDMTVDSGD